MKSIPPPELAPGYDTTAHKGALRRAGVADDVIAKLPQGSVVARGAVLLNAEAALDTATRALANQSDRFVSHGIPMPTGAAEMVSSNAAYLAGLRHGIELVTGGGNDRLARGDGGDG